MKTIQLGFILSFSFLVLISRLGAEEQQSQGYFFEKAVIRQLTNLEKLDISYTGEWDIPADFNKQRGLPISVKFIRWGNSIYLGDALRQRRIAQPFEMVIGFYEADLKSKTARIKSLHHITIQPEQWEKWWGDITQEEISELAQGIKHKPLGEAQAFARNRARELRAKSGVIDLNPKVNKDQRRIQCSIPFRIFYRDVLKQEMMGQSAIQLDKKEFPQEFQLGARSRN